MHLPLFIILPEKNSKETFLELIDNLINILKYSSFLFKKIDSRITEIDNRIEKLKKLISLIQERINIQNGSKLVIKDSKIQNILIHEFKSIYETVQNFKTLKSDVFSINMEVSNVSKDFLTYFKEGRVKKLMNKSFTENEYLTENFGDIRKIIYSESGRIETNKNDQKFFENISSIKNQYDEILGPIPKSLFPDSVNVQKATRTSKMETLKEKVEIKQEPQNTDQKR